MLDTKLWRRTLLQKLTCQIWACFVTSLLLGILHIWFYHRVDVDVDEFVVTLITR
jgi:hypothetical protein